MSGKAVELKDIYFKYNNFELSDITFDIYEGEKLALVGANGSGKTTLLRLMVNLLQRSKGSIKVFGTEVNRKNEWKIRKQIGFLFQNPDDQIFSPTVEEDIAFGPRNLKLTKSEITERVNWALKAVRIEKYRLYSPSNLSWGQKKLVALAGILAMNPKILFLDEPFANLDMIAVKELLEILESLRREQEMTILFTTHNHFFIQFWADRMVVLKNGKIIYKGIPNKGLNLPEVKKAIGTWDSVLDIIYPNVKPEERPHIHLHVHPHFHDFNKSNANLQHNHKSINKFEHD
ncbi:MAG: energy-coupling factor ABC transporter ATP-binding protein [Candidatus Helarchaeota archaeon]